jgi:hypothetical protein
VYRHEFLRITDPETWFPWTADMNEIKDRKKKLCDTRLRGEVCNSELYHAVIRLSEFLVQGPFEKPEAF